VGFFELNLQLDLLMAKIQQLRIEVLYHVIDLTHDFLLAIIQPEPHGGPAPIQFNSIQFDTRIYNVHVPVPHYLHSQTLRRLVREG